MHPYRRNMSTETSFLNMMIDNVISDLHPSRSQQTTSIIIPDTFTSHTIEEEEETDLSSWPMAEIRQHVQSPIPRQVRHRLRLRPLTVGESLLRINRTNRQPFLFPRTEPLYNIRNEVRHFIEDTILRQDTARAMLASHSEEVKMRPADEHTISQIKEKKCLGSNGSTCTICLDELKRGDMMKELSCKHQYHSGCIDEWLKRGDARCPNCNKRID
jgi:hypothetical protein